VATRAKCWRKSSGLPPAVGSPTTRTPILTLRMSAPVISIALRLSVWIVPLTLASECRKFQLSLVGAPRADRQGSPVAQMSAGPVRQASLLRGRTKVRG
jgi:hypothetical protein